MMKTMSAGIEAIRRFGWLPITVFLAHEVCAHVVDGYRLWPSVDIPLHFFGGLAIAYFTSGTLYVFAERDVVRMPDTVVHLLVTFGLTCSVAMLWELAEWTADHTLGTNCQLSIDDTMGDMFVGVLGGLTLAIPTAIKMHKRNRANQGSDRTGSPLRGSPAGQP